MSSLAVVRRQLDAGLVAYRAGNREEAKRLALSAYLDGFEPVEPMLGARNATLLAKVEQRMGELRASIAANRDPSEVASRIADVKSLSMKPKPRWRPIKPAMPPRFSEHSRSFFARASRPC